MNIPTISTARLILRPFTPADAETMHQIMSGKDVLRYFPGTKVPTQEQVRRMIGRLLQHWQEKNYGLWAVALKENGKLIGRCGLQHLPKTDEVEVDFILSRDYWGQGLATEAGLASIQFGFDVLKAGSMVGIVHPENIASQRVLEKIGLHFVEATEYFGMACYRYLICHPT